MYFPFANAQNALFAGHADYIITRNTKDFGRTAIPAITPEALINKLSN